ncbi:MAG: hypothetical protein KDK91_09425, partial [Gammaproteobacteria bacterium]|nr:hypothetical protein [Gammaproteobacteria bacterium]
MLKIVDSQEWGLFALAGTDVSEAPADAPSLPMPVGICGGSQDASSGVVSGAPRSCSRPPGATAS